MSVDALLSSRRGTAARSFARPSSPQRFIAEPLAGAEQVFALSRQRPASVLTGFQSETWLREIYRHLAPAAGATPLCVALHEPARGPDPFALLALETRRERGATVARFASFGVADYTAPVMVQPRAFDPVTAHAMCSALRIGLPGVDLLHLERMPASVANPLAAHPSAIVSDHIGNSLIIDDSVEAFIRARGKKYRKEVERLYRVLESEGTWTFKHAQTQVERAAALAALDHMQAQRHTGNEAYALSAPHYQAFHRAVAADTAGLVHLFTLDCAGTVIAAVLVIEHNGTVTLLRIANAGEAWKHVSPGRLIVVELMKFFTARGTRTIDLGIGDYAFKRGLGAEAIPLAELTLPLTLKGHVYASAVRLKKRLRANPQIKALRDRFKKT